MHSLRPIGRSRPALRLRFVTFTLTRPSYPLGMQMQATGAVDKTCGESIGRSGVFGACSANAAYQKDSRRLGRTFPLRRAELAGFAVAGASDHVGDAQECQHCNDADHYVCDHDVSPLGAVPVVTCKPVARFCVRLTPAFRATLRLAVLRTASPGNGCGILKTFRGSLFHAVLDEG